MVVPPATSEYWALPVVKVGLAKAASLSRATWTRVMYYVHSTSGPPAYEMIDAIAAERGVEVRYPFLDRQLVELCLRLPESHVRWRGEYRGLHKRAFGSRLPASLVRRTDKADLSRPYMRKMLAAVDRSEAVSAIGALGPRVEGSLLMATYATGLEAFERPPGEPGGFPLWAALSAGAAVSLA